MVFDDVNFYNTLSKITLQSYKIKKISEYMILYIDYANTILKIFRNAFNNTKNNDTHLALLYLIHEVLFQSHKIKNSKYIKFFGTILEDIIHVICEEFHNNIEIMKKLEIMIINWEKKMFFSYNFTTKLLNIVIDQKNKILESNLESRNSEDLIKNNIDKILNNKISKTILELNIEKKNIGKIYDNFEFDKLNGLLLENERLDTMKGQNNKKLINNYESKLNKIREMLIYDLAKRENLILNLTDLLNKEKETFFNKLSQENKRKLDNNNNKNLNNNLNNNSNNKIKNIDSPKND